MQPRESHAATRWDVLVLPDVIDAPTEDIARIEFIRAISSDPGLIRVSPHVEQEAEADARA